MSTMIFYQRTSQWSSGGWAGLSYPREGLAAVALTDGRIFTLGGWGEAEHQAGPGAVESGSGDGLALRADLRITEVCAADGSGWTRTADMLREQHTPLPLYSALICMELA